MHSGDRPRGLWHDRWVIARDAVVTLTSRLRRRETRARPTTLVRRLFLAYALVVGVAVAVLVLAPITVSVPTALWELVVILGGFAMTLVAYRVLLHRALEPLQRLTALMHRVDPLAPGDRLEASTADAEVAALADAFNQMLDRLELERRESGRRALAAQEDERRRIARELHDEIGQLLTGQILRGEALHRRAPAELRDDIADLREAARSSAQAVREIAQRLRPEALDELGLQSALLALATAVADGTGIRVERHLNRDLPPLSPEQELVIYRVAQEALTNVVRHACANCVQLRLEAGGSGGVTLTVRDDGEGLPADAHRRSNGIRGMRERALLVGARLTVGGAEPRGTEVVLHLPPGEIA